MPDERQVEWNVNFIACVDTGARQSVIGKQQAKAYCKWHKFKFKLDPSTTCFRFGNRSYTSLGSLKIRIPIPNRSFLSIQLDVLSVDVPLLLGLDYWIAKVWFLLTWQTSYSHLYWAGQCLLRENLGTSSCVGVSTKWYLQNVNSLSSTDIFITPQVQNFMD